ncbi:spore coat protein [Terribacillus saccharophilus]|uniref:spore coat protein n=1 Tax=Terribacillus saccharophilus TaxID=361277 RepID=UPI000BA77C65|nr:spore coat protein [Terribacillus saccharophilus]PAF22993.1 spore coat protein [Terribacillus saccharophilus]PAF36680.1 spore coat protein [Terribacillus saccharophilus]PAF40372.1 spore coat protein [Terribacillus saccharophilus]
MSDVWRPDNNQKWSALDPRTAKNFSDPDVNQEARQKSVTEQFSKESIYVIDSVDVEVSTTDTQAALTIQAALQAAIAVILNISIADSSRSDQIAQELFQKATVKQKNVQKTFVKNSRNVRVTTTDTDIAVNVQLLVQLLVALLVRVDIL